MINAERILLALDSRLDHEVSLVIYGRAALALGFEAAAEAVTRSLDVDAIIPVSQVPVLRNDTNFWDAQEAANRELEKEGLYITHLFEADQVFLRRDEDADFDRDATPSLTCSSEMLLSTHESTGETLRRLGARRSIGGRSLGTLYRGSGGVLGPARPGH
jgi:hypothetical protein